MTENKNTRFLSVGLLLNHPSADIFFIYVLGVIIRFVLSLAFTHGPTIQIDESLYIDIAKSLAAGEGIAFRSQPVPYLYIFYSLLMVPLYLFPLPFDLYRVVQLYNAFLMVSSVFPIYLFTRDFTGSTKKALLASAFTALMPDMLMSGFLMTESVIWPLSLWLIFFAYRLFTAMSHTCLYGVLTGLFTAFLFWTKPGSVVMGLVLLLIFIFVKDENQKKRRSAALAGLAVCIICILFFYLLYTLVFGYEFSALGFYSKQVPAVDSLIILAVCEFSVLQIILFAIACGGLFFVAPYACIGSYSRKNRLFIIAFTLALIAVAIGTAAFVDTHLWDGSFLTPRLHLRYLAMFVPVLIVFTLDISCYENNKSFVRALAVFSVLAVFPGASAGFKSGRSTIVDSVALSAWLDGFGVPSLAGIVLTVLLVFFSVIVIVQYNKKGLSLRLRKQCLLFLAIFLLCNNICGYIACNSGEKDAALIRDAVEINSAVESLSEPVLIITHYSTSDLLDSHLRKSLQQITTDEFLDALKKSDGFYVPFVPADQYPNINNHSTPVTNRFLFNPYATSPMELAENVVCRESSNGYFTLAQVPEGSRIVDSVLTGLDINHLHENEQAELVVFDESLYKNGRLTLHLSAYAKEDSAELEVLNAGKTQTITLSEKNRICLITLREGEATLTSHNGDVIISSYWTD